MGRNAEQFMEQISYWWVSFAKTADKVKYMDKMVQSWERLGKVAQKSKNTEKEKLAITIQALKDVIQPIDKIKRELEDGYQIDGRMAVALANDPNHLREIATEALKKI